MLAAISPLLYEILLANLYMYSYIYVCVIWSSFTGPQSVPARLIQDNISLRGSPQVPRSLPAFQNSPSLEPRRGSNQSQPSLVDRPPAPPPPPAASTIPLKIPQRTGTQTSGQYLRMNSAGTKESLVRTHLLYINSKTSS